MLPTHIMFQKRRMRNNANTAHEKFLLDKTFCLVFFNTRPFGETCLREAASAKAGGRVREKQGLDRNTGYIVRQRREDNARFVER
jgi:hypothetical protein